MGPESGSCDTGATGEAPKTMASPLYKRHRPTSLPDGCQIATAVISCNVSKDHYENISRH